jgi:hypothetical protein
MRTRATSNAGLEPESVVGLANRHKRASGACSLRASALIEAGVRGGRRCPSQGGDDRHPPPNRALLLSPNLERPAVAVRTIAFPVPQARGGRLPWRLSTRPLGTQPASRRTCPLAESTAFIRTLAISGKQQLASRGGGFDDRVGSVPAAERRPRAAPNGTALGWSAQCGSRSPLTAGIIGAGRSWTACTISVLSIPRKVSRRVPEVGMPELPLDDDQRHALARHLDRVGVPELMLVPTSAQA